MFSLMEVHQELQIWSVQHQIEQRAIAKFWAYLEEYKKSDSEEFIALFPRFSKDDFVLAVKEISLTTNWAIRTFSYVSVHISVFYRSKDYGWFHVVFHISGDYLSDTWTDKRD